MPNTACYMPITLWDDNFSYQIPEIHSMWGAYLNRKNGMTFTKYIAPAILKRGMAIVKEFQ